MTSTPSSRDFHFRSVTYAGTGFGPRLVVTGAVHGNETCGPRAIEGTMRELDAGKLYIARGAVTFVPIANPLAYALGQRAGDRNLNRNLTPTNEPREFEDHVANWLCPLLARHDVLLDLHSTRAATQPFALVGPLDNDGPLQPFHWSRQERDLARRLGVSRFVHGWLATYAKGVERRARAGTGSAANSDARYGIGTTEYMRSAGGYAVTLECGQHEDPRSVDVAARAIRNALSFLGLVDAEAPPPVAQYEVLRLDEVIDRNDEGDRFVREWSSFDRVRSGEVIGLRRDGGKVAADRDGWILFPDAGAKPGHEWFYLATPVDAL